MKQKIIGILIVLFWLGMMFSLFRDRIPLVRGKPTANQDLEPASLATSWEDQKEWMRLFYKGLEVGAMMSSLEKREMGEGYLLSSRLLFQLRILTLVKSVTMTASAVLDEEFILKRFEANVDLGESDWNILGFYHNGKLLYRIVRGGQISTGMFELESPPSLLDAVRSTVGKGVPLEPGDSYNIPVYDPIWSTGGGMARVHIVRKESITLGDQKYTAFRIETTLNNFTTTTWVDEEGKPLMRQIMPDVFMQSARSSDIIARYPVFADPVPPPKQLTLEDFRKQSQTGAPQNGGLQNVFQDIIQQDKEKNKK